MPDPLEISFQGAARTVTGSRHHLRFGERSFLFDCGLYQGRRDEADRVNRTFAFPPQELEAVVVSHAHLDHIGNLPTLASQGFRGRIHVTPATADLSRVLLEDSAMLMERDVDHVNRHRRAGAPERRALYGREDVERVTENLVTHDYHASWELGAGVRIAYQDAGHILGSALTVLEFTSGGRTLRLGMSGDLGRPGRPILRDPETLPGVDVLVMESTYGDRLHPDAERTERELAEIVERTLARGGRVMIPAFAVGRTQELVATLHELMERRAIRDVPIYVDSPMASKATAVFRRHPECFDAETRRAFESGDGAPFGFNRLRYVSSPEESRALNEHKGAMILIAASGMCEGGRILHHLEHGLGEAKNSVLFVGFQAPGTLGRRLRDGVNPVNIFGEPVQCRAEIAALDGFSAHADQRELLDWASRIQPAPRRIFLVHGEPEPAETLAALLRERTKSTVAVPERGQRFDLWN
jgi:metallo-beta-lactamase family protein